ncbi:uncharacterized protein [Nicotiana tomentosiformis]|uniref:uncharacterized protein n=1 Tax=Nicotiana tomentosiformis TaxID=4098 RepID=UPI00388C5042
MGQIENLLSERTPGTLPSDTEKNPKETIKVISLRSGKALTGSEVKARPEVISKHIERPEEKVSEEQNSQSSGAQKEIEESRHMSAPPFPQKMKREKLDKCFGKFLELLKQLYVNIPFKDVLTQMPNYAKFLKEILSSKRKLEETTLVKLNTHCNAILQNRIPQKCVDLGSFTIPCSLGNETFDKALCDSGASINLLPLSIFRKLEDILVRVDKFVFPVDFIMVDMEVNKERCITQSSIVEDEDPEIKKEVEALEIEDQVVDEEELKKEADKPNV